MNICDLSSEVILYILDYCDLQTLRTLRFCCKKFNEIILNSTVYTKHAIVTNQVRNKFKNRCYVLLESYEKWRISHNWLQGRFRKKVLFKQFVKYMPWLNLSKEHLWLSEGDHIKSYKRKKYNIDTQPELCLKGLSDQDVTKFVYKNGFLLAGARLGSLWLYSTRENDMIFDIQDAHMSDVTCVDLNNDIFITGSRDEYFKVWPLTFMHNNELPKPHTKFSIDDKIWSVGLAPNGQTAVIGSSGFNRNAPLHIYDLQGGKIIGSFGKNFWRGSGVLDVHYENDNILLSCGYDTYLRKWDLRVGKCVQEWMDPHDSAYYCLASDSLYTVMCGSNIFGRVVLWDQRVKNYIQLYYTHRLVNNHLLSSPVYSMSFDSCQLYTALDSYLVILDFSIKQGKVLNYNIPAFQYENCYLATNR